MTSAGTTLLDDNLSKLTIREGGAPLNTASDFVRITLTHDDGRMWKLAGGSEADLYLGRGIIWQSSYLIPIRRAIGQALIDHGAKVDPRSAR